MGLDHHNDARRNENQLDLFSFAPPVESPTDDATNDRWDFEFREVEPSKSPRFVTISAGVHILAAIVISMMTIPLIEQTQTETITIEIEDVSPPQKMAKGITTSPTQGAAPEITAALPEKSEPKLEPIFEPSLAQEVPVITTKIKPAPPTKSSSKTLAKASALPKAVQSSPPTTNFKAVPLTVDDIEAPELDAGDYATTDVDTKLSEDFNDDFENIDRSQKAALEKEKRTLEDMANALAAEQEESLNALDESNKAETEQLAAAQENLRRKNSAAIASALAAENAAQAARAAAAREAARQASAAAAGRNRQSLGEKPGAGMANNGLSTPSNQIAGMPAGVRSLDQLRQMPGNPRPAYDNKERLQGHKGDVAFVAYINKSGTVTQFRMLKSTGFRNLDSKTLAALKKWRFYPGQEGWVELPFRWDLKGGVQQDGGLLRRSISRR